MPTWRHRESEMFSLLYILPVFVIETPKSKDSVAPVFVIETPSYKAM